MARSLALVCALVVCLIAASTSAADYARGKSPARAADLVDAALEAELAGDAAKRGELLSRAIDADADYAPARWQSGQVKFEGKWRTPPEVGKLVVQDRRWKEYRQRREAASSLADHIELARWCLREGLTQEERFHWAVVLLADPAHRQARKRLGLREYRGGLFTEEQVAQHQQQLKDAEANLRRHKPRFLELCRQARSESQSLRAAALKKISAVTDVGAIEALDDAVQRNSGKPSDPKTRDLHLAYVTALSNIRAHEATLRLLNQAVFSPIEQVRQLAARLLQPRPTTDYVPLLMGALSAPIETKFDVVAAPDGTVRMMETVFQSGPEADAEHVQNTNFEVQGVFGRDVAKTNPIAVLGGHLDRAVTQAEQTQEIIDKANAAAAERNARIQETLKIAAGMDYGNDPELWWKAWADENELQYSDAEPVYRTYDEETHTYAYEQAKEYPLIQGRMNQPGQVSATTSATQPTVLPGVECFAPGTPVWTQSGPVPIEQIAVGDMVLAQHPETGELDYRPVLETTLGDPVRVVRITLPGESITSTLGHRFWVNGRGWQMAKALKPQMMVKALDRGLDVVSIQEVEPVSCHNLIVDEFHTFFVGESRLLVHDKSCPRPTTASLPGRVETKYLSAELAGR